MYGNVLFFYKTAHFFIFSVPSYFLNSYLAPENDGILTNQIILNTLLLTLLNYIGHEKTLLSRATIRSNCIL